jgi:hypothetical protein
MRRIRCFIQVHRLIVDIASLCEFFRKDGGREAVKLFEFSSECSRDYLRSRKGTGTTAVGYIIHSLAGLPSDRHRMAATENPTLNFNLEAVKVHRE